LATWMVVEDEPEIYELLVILFKSWGIEGAAFVDGSEAIAWIEDLDSGRIKTELPVLAIIDLRLPGAPGQEVAARLRQSAILGNIAIVLITGYYTSPRHEEEIMARSQADLLLIKPLPRTDEFRRTLEETIVKRAERTVREPLTDEIETEAVEAIVDEAPAMVDEDAEEQERPVEDFSVYEQDSFALMDIFDFFETDDFFTGKGMYENEDGQEPTEPVDAAGNRDLIDPELPLA
jgi:CheY-like chemotaxis protein